MKLILILISGLIFTACSHGLPYRDLQPEKAKSRGYVVSAEETKARGGVGNNIPTTCYAGGWGGPAKDCDHSPITTTSTPQPAAVAMADTDEDHDGVIDRLDQCKGTPSGVKVNAFGCPVGQKVEIRLNVEFHTGTTNMVEGDRQDVSDLASILKANPNLKVRLEGHTDSSGNPKTNQTLSEKRASAIRELLVKEGVPAEQLTSAGFGSTRPVADNSTAAGKKKNRRVTAVLVD